MRAHDCQLLLQTSSRCINFFVNEDQRGGSERVAWCRISVGTANATVPPSVYPNSSPPIMATISVVNPRPSTLQKEREGSDIMTGKWTQSDPYQEAAAGQASQLCNTTEQ